MSDFKYIVPPNEPKIIRSPGEVGISPTIPFVVNNSILFTSSGSPNLNRTLSSSGNRRTWTWSGWIRRFDISGSSNRRIFGQSYTNTSEAIFYFNTSNQLRYEQYEGGGASNNFNLTSVQLFRDPSAWYHVVLVWNTTNSISTERIKMYVNGVRIDLFSASAFPTLNYEGVWNNSTHTHYLGFFNTQAFDGYMTDINFIDGLELGPENFGQYDNRTEAWVAKRYNGSFGTTGYRLNFSSNANLGLDTSGLNNNFTVSSVTQTINTPNNNFATLNTVDFGTNNSLSANYSYVNQSGVGTKATKSLTFPVKSGKWYWEVMVTNGSATSVMNTGSVGIYVGNVAGGTRLLGEASDDWAWRFDGNKFNNNSASAFGTGVNSNTDVVMVAFDADSGRLWFGKNNSWFGSGDPASGINPAYTVGIGQGNFYIFAIGSLHGGGGTAVHNVKIYPSGNFANFSYTPPTGFRALSSQNLRIPNIRKSSDYFKTIVYQGNTTIGRKISTGFTPSFVWIKNITDNANGSSNQILADIFRGPSNILQADRSDIETSSSTGGFLNSFDSDGFSLGSSTGTNETGKQYVSYIWKSGSIPGFNIISYIGDGTNNRAIAHGLGKTPGFIIVKDRDFNYNWDVWHQHGGLTATSTIGSDGVSASLADRNVSAFGTTNPDSTNFYVQNTFTNGRAGDRMIAYCFTDIDGFSRFGAYNGNNSSDGPFVYTGFRPRMILAKCINTGAGNNWVLLDSERYDSGYAKGNPVTRVTIPNQYQNDQRNFAFIDFLSNGFKLRMSTYEPNASSNLYIFAAFAESPFKYANAR